MDSIEEFTATYEVIQEIYKECVEMIHKGVAQEESHPENALATFKEAINLIDRAMLIPIVMPMCANNQEAAEVEKKMKEVKKMIFNFKMQRSEILLRIGAIYHRNDVKEDVKGAENSPKKRARTLHELENVLKEIGKVKPNDIEKNNLIEILFCCNGVKMYYIEANGNVVSSMEDFALRIVKLGCDFEHNLNETIFLQLIKASDSSIEIEKEIKKAANGATEGSHQFQADPSFIYPLVPGVSPCFRSKFHAFIFPDLVSNDGSTIGLIVPEEFDGLLLDILVLILKGVVKDDGHVEFGGLTTRSFGEKVSENIVGGAHWVSMGLMKLAEETNEFINFSTPYVLSTLHKAKEIEAPLSVKIEKGAHEGAVAVNNFTHGFTGYVAKGTSYAAEKFSKAMTDLGRFLAPHVQNQYSKLRTFVSGKENERDENTMTESLKIVSGAADGFSTIYSGLENSASVLGRNITENSVKFVDHKYGMPMGHVATDTSDTVGNLYNVERDFNIMTPKGFVRTTATNAGKEMTMDSKPVIYLNKNYFTGSMSLHPNLDNLAKELNNPITGRN